VALTIRRFNEGDVEFALSQTAREGWDTTAELFSLSLKHDPEGCFIAEVGGEPAGMVTSTRYGASAWLGNLIVVPHVRRQGVGDRLMSHAIAALSRVGVRTFRLEADPPGVGLYRRLGFVDQFSTIRFRKEPPHRPHPERLARQVTADDVEDVAAYDRTGFGDDRARLLARIIELTPRAVCVRREDGKVLGYAATLPSAAGVRFGPCVADDAAVAAELLDVILSASRNLAVVTAVPEVNTAAVALMQSRGFEAVGSCRRMRLGPPAAESDPHKLVAIAYGAIG
jgi:ribosomal protein S18 acetylase RimI-like enzyme